MEASGETMDSPANFPQSSAANWRMGSLSYVTQTLLFLITLGPRPVSSLYDIIDYLYNSYLNDI
jgi:hypothetical protein